MKKWEQDKATTDAYLPTVKALIGKHLISEAPIEEDRERNSDLISLKLYALRIGCRLRRDNAFSGWPSEFTIRTSRPSGIKTEFDKIIEGWGDYFFYGFMNPEAPKLLAWTLADLRIFRSHYVRQLRLGVMLGRQQWNPDGSSGFHSFQWDEFPKEFVVATRGVPVSEFAEVPIP